MTTWYATTTIHQNGVEFRCTWDLVLLEGNCDELSALNHLDQICIDAEDAFQENYEEGEKLNFFGMHPSEFANFIVKNEEETKSKFKTTWEIRTHSPSPAEGKIWEHPCN